MARTQILSSNIKDNDIKAVDIAAGAIGESIFTEETINTFKFVKLENIDFLVPEGYGLIVPNEYKIHGELRILGEMKIC